MSTANAINLKVFVFETDYYALQQINSYLAWDRRTRVKYLAETVAQLWQGLDRAPQAEAPDILVLAVDELGGAQPLQALLTRMRQQHPRTQVVCLSQHTDSEMIQTAAAPGARAFLLKGEVRLRLARALVFARDHDFTVTPAVAKACKGLFDPRIMHAAILPENKDVPELTERVRQAILLCVVEGMPAALAADEMGISPHTLRGYIKEGYRILETHDDATYPAEMTPQERAFLRFTALDEDKK
jgi:DNA-binding NarL/FixJ family response regulator